MTISIDVKENGIESGFVTAPFDIAIDELSQLGYEVIPLQANIDLRLEQGIDSPVTRNNDGYVCNGCMFHKDRQGIFVAVSPMIADRGLLTKVVKANRKGRHWDTGNSRLYDETLEIVEEDASRDPHDRRAMLLPSKGQYSEKIFPLSPKENPELFAMMLGKNGKRYLEMICQQGVNFYQLDQSILKKHKGTVPTQVYFGAHANFGPYQSVIQGDRAGLGVNNRTRGIRKSR